MRRILTSAASAFALAAILSAAPLAAQDLIVNNATLALGDGSEPIEDGLVVIKDGEVISNKIGAAPKAVLQSWIDQSI